MTRLLLAGALLGVLSRVDETAAIALPVSDNATWILAAVLAGLLVSRRPSAAGAVVLTAANLAYYAWIAVTGPGLPLGDVAGSPWHWLVLGVLTGTVFGAAGGLARRGRPAVAAAALVLPVAVVALDRAGTLELLMP